MHRNKLFSYLLVFISILGLISCEQDRTSSKGLHFPDGNIVSGQKAFVELRCHRCHTVADVELPAIEMETTPITINLGGEVRHVKTHGELVSSIINPNHVISQQYIIELGELAKENGIESAMPSFNDEMTIAQMIDIVKFLDSHYEKLSPRYDNTNVYLYYGP